MRMPALLAIGELARQTGLTVSALRYYEERGLIVAASRCGGKRRFAAETRGRVLSIRRAQSLGFTLDEIRTLLDDSSGGWHALVDAKIVALTAKQEAIRTMLATLQELKACACAAPAKCSRGGAREA